MKVFMDLKMKQNQKGLGSEDYQCMHTFSRYLDQMESTITMRQWLSWWVGELVSWWACELVSCRAGELVSWWVGELVSLWAGELVSWWAGELVSWTSLQPCWLRYILQALVIVYHGGDSYHSTKSEHIFRLHSDRGDSLALRIYWLIWGASCEQYLMWKCLFWKEKCLICESYLGNEGRKYDSSNSTYNILWWFAVQQRGVQAGQEEEGVDW